MTRALFVGILAVVALALPVEAQDEAGLPVVENPNVFLEKSYLSPFMPSGKKLILEGQASTHFWLRNTLTDEVWRREGGWKWVNVPVSMIFVVRIFDDVSAPVRTPSFILRPLYLQAVRLSRWREGKWGKFRLFSAAIGGTHHSNGQAGCTFQGQARNASDECVVSDAALFAQRKANRTDGSFSTNFFSFDAGFREGWLDNNATLDHQFSVRFRYENHPLDLLMGGLQPDLAERYGQHLVSFAVEAERRWACGTGRAELSNQWRFGGKKTGADVAGQLGLSWLLARAEHFGFFARFHWGADYYNIHFQNRDPFFQAGLMWDPQRLDQFVRRRGE